MILAAVLLATLAAPPARAPFIQDDSTCLHAAGRETQQQRQRSVAALSATRAINTAESAYAAKMKGYATREELAGFIDATRFNLIEDADVVPGFTLTLDATPKGYWFMVADKTDPCGFRFISNQQGLIFTAQPIQ